MIINPRNLLAVCLVLTSVASAQRPAAQNTQTPTAQTPAAEAAPGVDLVVARGVQTACTAGLGRCSCYMCACGDHGAAQAGDSEQRSS